MRKMILFAGIAIFFAVSFISAGYPADKSISAAAKVKAKPASQAIETSGQVTWCDSQGKYMTIRNDKMPSVSLEINKKTLIKKKGKKIKFSEIKKGTKVLVKYENVNGGNIAKSIVIQEDSGGTQTKSHSK